MRVSCHQILTLIVAILQLASIAEADKKDGSGLYSTEDDVLALNSTALTSKVLNGKDNIVWVVEFYNSWCGHCIQFAPTWKKFATSLKGWSDLVRIAAIDCSQAINLEACRKYEIDKYPSLKMLSPSFDKNLNKSLNHRDLESMTRKVVDFMTQYPPPSWPRLQPLAKIEDIWSEKKDHHKYVALIFEKSTSQVGRKVVLDMRNSTNLLVRTMLSTSVAQFGLTHFPSLYEINEDSRFRLLGNGNKMASQDRQLFVKMLQVLSRGDGDKLDFSLAKKKDSLAEKNKQDVIAKDKKKVETVLSPPFSQIGSSRVSMQDLESALHYGFRQEIAICKTIEGPKFNALKKFVEVLLKYFPGRSPIMKFLKSISQMLSSVTTSHLSGGEWLNKTDDLQNSESFLPEVKQWDCCKGSMPRYRGYPCAMWTLFHVLTVGAYSQQSLTHRAGNPLEVPLAIRGYMDHFFGCAECSKHFLSMAASMEHDITDAKGAVLWLWSAHNKVNRRLKGDQSEDKMFPKVQFPPPSLCEKCHSTKETNASEPIWNMESVFKFLVSFYVGKNIYFSPELSKGEFHSSSNDDAKVNEKGRNSTLNGGARSKLKSSDPEELDWWEGKQREQDLKQAWKLRERKKEKKRDLKEAYGEMEKLVAGNPPQDGQDFAEYKIKRGNGLREMFNDLDLSMCVIFYVISTVIILGLYHHFIIRKKASPCPKHCLR